MAKKLAFVLGGGGARGALQVGALYALLEIDRQPDLVIGTSIGAVNAAFVAMNGFSEHGLNLLTRTWHAAKDIDLLPNNYLWLTMRAMFGRSIKDPSQRVRDFIIANGLTPEICFSDLARHQLAIVSSDLNTGKPVLHGLDPQENILEAVLLSTTLPPWSFPVKKQGHYLMDGGVVSNLPVEPALQLGATEIVALDLMQTAEPIEAGSGVGGFVDQLIFAVEKRHSDLEIELAAARGIPLVYLGLVGEPRVALWDFTHTDALIEQGYKIARQVISRLDLRPQGGPSR